MSSVRISNIPFELTKPKLIEMLSSITSGKITDCHLRNHPRRYGWNCGWATIHFEKEDDAARLLRRSKHNPPRLLGRRLEIDRVKKRTIHDVSTGEEYLIDSLELGSWGGVSVAKKRKKRNRNEETVWTFLSEYKHPEYWKIKIQQKEFIKLTLDNGASKNRIYINVRVLDEQCKGVIIDTSGEHRGELIVYLTLKHPPELYKTLDVFDLVNEDDNWSAWSRCGDWSEHQNVFGQFLVYRLVLTENIRSVQRDLSTIDDNLQDCPVVYKSPHSLDDTMEAVIYPLLPFKLNFKLECLLSHNVLTIREVFESNLLNKLLDVIEEKSVDLAWLCLNQLLVYYWDPADAQYNKRPISYFDEILTSLKNDYKTSRPNEENARYALVNHATVTPTKIVYEGPVYETSNRILREFSQYTDRFLRVRFAAENLEKLFSVENMKCIYEDRVLHILRYGLRCAGRHYEFLAFSSSGLREHACWFVAADGDFSAESIRAWMGDLSSIRSPALFGARMGQTFTSTIGTIEVNPDQVRYIDDIKRNGYVFSDGCGKISYSLAEKAIKKYWGKREVIDEEIPSVYQIRFRGCKGVVAIDKALEGDVLCIRPSQKKFESYESYTLEIAKTVAHPQQGHLNRQIILLLSNLGIPDSEFLELQEHRKSFIESMMQDSKRAAEVVRQISRDGSHQTRTILEMLKVGLMDEEEPFLEAMLEVKKLFTLKDLKNKARIEVPSTFLLMGVVDETGILEPDQIYVQTSAIISEHQSFKGEKKVRRKHHVWTGRSIVTRNPCLHPGDISVLWAVDVPELSHLKNCVVFSQYGDSPVVNSMAGGDLDGDEFFVSFDGRLIPTETHPSLNYDAPERKELDRCVNIYDIAEFFRDFMENDRLGTICNNHLTLADQKPLGVFSPECIDLAKMASMAVDFNKTGVPVTARLPTSSESPDFMENPTKPKYKSQKILGKLYRNIDLDEYRDNEKRYYRKYPIQPFNRFVYDGYNYYIEDALVQRDNYNQEVRNLMQRYKIKSEPEVFTGSLLSAKTCGKRLYDVRDAIASDMAIRITNYRRTFKREFEEEDTEYEDELGTYVPIPINDETKAKASAWYIVTYDRITYPDEYAEDDKNCLLSFPWIVSDILLDIWNA